MPLWLLLAWKECLHNRLFSLFFALNLALGLFGLIAIDTFKSAIQQDLSLRSKSILTADLSVSAIRPLKPAEQKLLAETLPPADISEERTLYSMITAPNTTRLVDIQAIDSRYPLYGELTLQRAGLIQSDSPKSLLTKPEIWVYPEVLAQLGLRVGESLSIGKQRFIISDVVLKDTGSSGIGFRFAPKVYIGTRWLESTGLIQTGSRISYFKLHRFNNQDEEALATQLRERLRGNPDLRVRTHREVSAELSRSLNHLNDYLGLVALVALFLASVGASYLFRSFILKRSREIAVLQSLGLSPRKVWAVYVSQLLLLGLLASTIALVMSLGFLPLLPRLLGEFVPAGLDLSLKPRLFLLASSLGLGGSLFFCLPLLGHLQRLRPAELFRENARPTLRISWHILGYLPAIALYTGLAIWQSRSWLIGSVVVAAFGLAGLILGGLAFGLLRGLDALFTQASLPLRLAVRSLSRQPVASVSSFLAIALALLLLTLIPQIRNGMLADLTYSESSAPGLFLFDIQDDQLENLRSFLKQKQAPLQQVYPMVRANLERIKGEAVVSKGATQNFSTREADEDEAVRTRRYNLSTRPKLLPTEELAAGREFKGTYNWNGSEPAELSIDTNLARSLKVTIGDSLDFDLQGVEIKGKIVNLRKVKWTNFEPNFRVLIQPGVLDDAPKTWIGTVPPKPLHEKIALQQALVQAFPTLALIDVSSLIQQIVSILKQIAAILQGMALIVLLAGFAVLYSIASYQARERVPDIALLKVLGSRFGLIRASIALEFGLLTGLAASAGAAAGMATSWVLSVWVFESIWVPSLLLPLSLITASTALGIIIGLLSTARVLASPPKRLLES